MIASVRRTDLDQVMVSSEGRLQRYLACCFRYYLSFPKTHPARACEFHNLGCHAATRS
jgi:hypothetical protein